MSILKTLKLTNAVRNNLAVSEYGFRAKVLSYLAEQKLLAEAEIDGTPFQASKVVTRINEAGHKQVSQLPRKVRKGWFTDSSGKLFFNVRYGSKPLELAKGMNAVQVPSFNELPATIASIIEATNAGELDSQISAAIAERKAHFRQAGQENSRPRSAVG